MSTDAKPEPTPRTRSGARGAKAAARWDKPAALTPAGCIVADKPGFATQARADLMGRLSAAGFADDAARAFLDECAAAVHMLSDESDPATTAQLSAGCARIDAACAAVLDGLRDLPAELICAIEGRALVAARSGLSQLEIGAEGRQVLRALQADQGVLSGLWELAHALHLICVPMRVQASALERATSPQIQGQRLLERVLSSYVARFNALPPDNRDAWFVGFMGELARQCHGECGPRPVAREIEKRRAI